MQPRYRLLFILLLFICAKASAQKFYTISGTVTDSIGTPQKAATVFISGTKRITGSDDKGEFTFDKLPAGTYQLSVSMVGFNPFAQNVVIGNSPVKLNVMLKSKTETLHEVVIGADSRLKYMTMFKNAFLGYTENARACTLLNPDALNFHFDKKTGILTVDADEMLVLESKRLGYRIKYLLKDFSYDTNIYGVLYDGETSFEELPGTEVQKQDWIKNRLATYQGSMMHFLRSVYHRELEKQGFVIYNLYGLNPVVALRSNAAPVLIDATPIDINKLLTRVDSALTAFKFQVLYVDYAGAKAIKLKPEKSNNQKRKIVPSDNSSILKLVAPEAVIDARGSCTDYRAFYLKGVMGDKRVGDQLPFEYQPPAR